MDTNITRRRAIKLSVFGALAIVFIVYFAAWLLTYIAGSLLEPIDRSTKDNVVYSDNEDIQRRDNVSVQVPDNDDLKIRTQLYSQELPYQTTYQVYVATGDSAMAGLFNSEVQTYINEIQDQFESDLVYFLGNTESPNSSLEIIADSISAESNKIIIDYIIITFIAGDTGSQTQNLQQIIN